MSEGSATAPEPTPTACACCREGHGTSECWSQAYHQGRSDFINEIHAVLIADFEGHYPGHDCDVCRIIGNVARMAPPLHEVMDNTAEWVIAVVSDPHSREALKTLIADIEAAERLN